MSSLLVKLTNRNPLRKYLPLRSESHPKGNGSKGHEDAHHDSHGHEEGPTPIHRQHWGDTVPFATGAQGPKGARRFTVVFWGSFSFFALIPVLMMIHQQRKAGH